jgi:hypothetical protein
VSSLPLDIIRVNFERELPRARECAERHGWKWQDNVEGLIARAEFTALDGERFILQGEFDEYKAKPPFLEFEEPDTGMRGTRKAYPKSNDSFFHPNGPIICAPFSRKAYREVHKRWQFGDWMTSKENGVNWAQYSTIAGMFALVYNRITHPDCYKGRMG